MIRKKIEWNFNSLNNYTEKIKKEEEEECNIDEEEDEVQNKINQLHLGESKFSSNNLDNISKNLNISKTTNNTNNNSVADFHNQSILVANKKNISNYIEMNASFASIKTSPLEEEKYKRQDAKAMTYINNNKVKMNPEIEEVLNRINGNFNKQTSMTNNRNKKVDSIRKCFDGDEER